MAFYAEKPMKYDRNSLWFCEVFNHLVAIKFTR